MISLLKGNENFLGIKIFLWFLRCWPYSEMQVPGLLKSKLGSASLGAEVKLRYCGLKVMVRFLKTAFWVRLSSSTFLRSPHRAGPGVSPTSPRSWATSGPGQPQKKKKLTLRYKYYGVKRFPEKQNPFPWFCGHGKYCQS